MIVSSIPKAGYTFDASAQTITFIAPYNTIELGQINLITNVKDGIVIYQFQNTAKLATGGTIAAGVLTLDYNTQTMADTDELKFDVKFDNGVSPSSAVSSIQKPSYDANVGMTITNLSALASSATVGWQSDRVSNLATRATDYLINVKATMANTAPGGDKCIYVYAVPWYTTDGGTTWYTADGGTATLPSGTNSAYTIASPNNMRLLGVLNYTTQNMVCQNNFLLSNAFGNRMPHGWSLVLINYTGAALATTSGTNNIVSYAPMFDALT